MTPCYFSHTKIYIQMFFCHYKIPVTSDFLYACCLVKYLKPRYLWTFRTIPKIHYLCSFSAEIVFLNVKIITAMCISIIKLILFIFCSNYFKICITIFKHGLMIHYTGNCLCSIYAIVAFVLAYNNSNTSSSCYEWHNISASVQNLTVVFIWNRILK